MEMASLEKYSNQLTFQLQTDDGLGLIHFLRIPNLLRHAVQKAVDAIFSKNIEANQHQTSSK